MKKVALLIAVALLVIILAGCSGGSSTSESTSTPSTTGAAPAVGAPGTPGGSSESEVPRAFEKSNNTPEFFSEALKKDQPILILFYGEDDISQDVLVEAKKVMDDKYYGGGAVFMFMDIDENDEIKNLAKDLNIGYVPYTAVISRRDQVIFEKNGYVDNKLLEQALYDAMNKQI